MQRASRPSLRFVRALLSGGEARLTQSGRFDTGGNGGASLAAADVRLLMSAGVLKGDQQVCRVTPQASQWLKREMLEVDAFAAQHRLPARGPDGVTLNLAESPLAHLAAPRNNEPPFLQPHHLEAGERVRRLAERAQLRPRVTMSYSAVHSGGGKSFAGPSDLSDLAVDSRRQLDEIARILPRDCAGVVLDVCGLLKGLQMVESERGWPRRSAKLVLRIGLEQLALHYGFAAVAVGRDSVRNRAWMASGSR